MTPERWQQVRQLLAAAVALPLDQRKEFLETSCGTDLELRTEVESLLVAHEQAQSEFLETPVADLISLPPTAPIVASRAGRRIGSYLVIEEIGHGGMGEVYRAVRADGEFNKEVAIKLVRGGYNSATILERFRNERQILAGLDHPNIASLLDGGTMSDGTPYLVMELVEGAPIDDYCDSKKLPITERLNLFRKVCGAVQYAHQRLVIHRDLKPSNILVTANGVPKLLDFGIAKLVDPSAASEATILRPMTPEYASPEQIRGETITTSSDVYSLGVVLYWLITGRSPYRTTAQTPAELSRAISEVDPENPSTAVTRSDQIQPNGGASRQTPENLSAPREGSPLRLQRRLRGDIDFIVLKALRKEPQQRYVSAEQLSEDIRRHLEGLPVIARKGTWHYKTAKFTKRHKASVAAALLVLLAISAGVASTVRQTRIAQRRFDETRKLANSLIFDIHDSIADLPGATTARNLILQKALEYLDSLAKESGNEPDLLRELATAYQRIGTLQGNEQVPNLGDANSAQSSLSKSMELRERIALLNPNNRKDQVALAASYLEYSQYLTSTANDTAKAYGYVKKGIAILDRQIVVSPNDVRVVLNSTQAYYTLGMMQVGEGAMGSVGTVAGGVADLKKSAVIAEHAVQLSPDNIGLRIHISLIDELLGDASFRTGDRQQALAYYQSALAKINAINSEGNNVRVLSNTIDIKSRMGDVYFADGDLEKCVTTYDMVTQQVKKLLDADPSNETLRNQWFSDTAQLGYAVALNGHGKEGLADLRQAISASEAEPSQTGFVHTQQGVMHDWAGEALELQGKQEEAFHEYEIAKKLFEGLRASGANDQRIQLYYAVTLNHFAASLSNTGKPEQARHEIAESIGILEPLGRANPEDREVRYALADAYTNSGMVATRLAERESTPSHKLIQWQSARDFFQLSLTLWQQIPNPGYISPTGFKAIPPGKVSHSLAQCDRQIKILESSKN